MCGISQIKDPTLSDTAYGMLQDLQASFLRQGSSEIHWFVVFLRLPGNGDVSMFLEMCVFFIWVA